MPFFVFQGVDRLETGPIRTKVREQHRAHLRLDHEGCRFVSGGPLVADNCEDMCGSLLIFEADSRACVERVLDSDPYKLADIYVSTSLFRLNWTVGRPE